MSSHSAIRSLRSSLLVASVLLCPSLTLGDGGITFNLTEETEYEGPEDGPLFQGGCYEGGQNYAVEDFEGGALSAGLILSGAFEVLEPGDDTDSVDDGGHSLLAALTPNASATFAFDSAVLGDFPVDVGFMLTDDGDAASFDLLVIDGAGNQAVWSVNSPGEDDRFVSIFAPSGVVSVTLIGEQALEIDHIQYSIGAAPTHRRGDVDKSGTGDLLIQKPGKSIGAWLLDDTDEFESEYENDDNGGDDGEDENESESENELAEDLSDEAELVAVADLDNDCDGDLIWRIGSKVKVWLMEGNAVSKKVVIDDGLSAAWKILAVDDFDGNGSADILAGKASSEKLRVWTLIPTSDGIEIDSNKPISTGSFKLSKHELITTGDINGDGKADVVWRRKSDGDIRGWTMNGHQIASSKLILDDYSTNWESLGGGDTNGDGVRDLVFRSKSSGKVSICCLSENLSVADQQTHEGLANYEFVACSDIDGNGCDDLVWRKNSSTGKVVRWSMTPAGPSSTKTIGYVGNTSVRVYGAK